MRLNSNQNLRVHWVGLRDCFTPVSMGKSLSYPLLIVLLISPVLPSLMAFLLVWVGLYSGCELAGQTAAQCTVMGLDTGWAIAQLVEMTWNFPLLGQFPFLWVLSVLGVLILIHTNFQGLLRLLLGLGSIWYISIAPSVLGILFVVRLTSLAGCRIHEKGLDSCLIFGVEMSHSFSTITLLPWLTTVIVLFCGATSITYLALLQCPHSN